MIITVNKNYCILGDANKNEFQKLFTSIVLSTSILFVGTFTYQSVEQTHVSHAASYNYYNKHQCTWWAFKRRAQVGKPVSNRWGMRKLGTKTQNVLDMLQVINHVDT